MDGLSSRPLFLFSTCHWSPLLERTRSMETQTLQLDDVGRGGDRTLRLQAGRRQIERELSPLQGGEGAHPALRSTCLAANQSGRACHLPGLEPIYAFFPCMRQGCRRKSRRCRGDEWPNVVDLSMIILPLAHQHRFIYWRAVQAGSQPVGRFAPWRRICRAVAKAPLIRLPCLDPIDTNWCFSGTISR